MLLKKTLLGSLPLSLCDEYRIILVVVCVQINGSIPQILETALKLVGTGNSSYLNSCFL